MLKLILCMVIITGSTAVGFYYSHRLYERRNILKSFVIELEKCSTSMSYTSSELYRIFENNFMDYEFKSDTSFESQWSAMLGSYKDKLKKEDLELLHNFSESLGISDVISEQKNIRLYIQMLEKNIVDAENDIKEKSKVSQTLGFCVGVIISILLI